MFETGAYIVCGQTRRMQGGKHRSIRLAEASAGRDYYTLSPLYSKGGVVYVPADSEKIIMRYVISRQEAEQLIGEIDGMDMIPIDNERQREETLKRALKTCDTRQWVRVIKTINVRREKRLAQGKKVTAGDERCLHAAQEKPFWRARCLAGD